MKDQSLDLVCLEYYREEIVYKLESMCLLEYYSGLWYYYRKNVFYYIHHKISTKYNRSNRVVRDKKLSARGSRGAQTYCTYL